VISHKTWPRASEVRDGDKPAKWIRKRFGFFRRLSEN
jgi:hypothetical protein